MKRGKNDTWASVNRLRLIQVLMGVLFLYLVWMSFEIPVLFKTSLGFDSPEVSSSSTTTTLKIYDFIDKGSPEMFSGSLFVLTPGRRMRELKKVSGLVFDESALDSISKDEYSELLKMVRDAFVVGKNLWGDIESGKVKIELEKTVENYSESCPDSVSLSGDEFIKRDRMIMIPCGLALGSHITVVGKPYGAHPEKDPKIVWLKEGQESAMVSQFMMELQGLKAVDGEDPPRILHFNPRLKGDFSGRPVIEQNTCYRMQWGSAWRCEGWKSKADEETGK